MDWHCLANWLLTILLALLPGGLLWFWFLLWLDYRKSRRDFPRKGIVIINGVRRRYYKVKGNTLYLEEE